MTENKDIKRITEITLFDIIKGVLFFVLLFVLFFASEGALAVVAVVIGALKAFPVLSFLLFIILMIAVLVAAPAGSIVRAGFPLHILFKSKKDKKTMQYGN
jgi:hypothetical protein